MYFSKDSGHVYKYVSCSTHLASRLFLLLSICSNTFTQCKCCKCRCSYCNLYRLKLMSFRDFLSRPQFTHEPMLTLEICFEIWMDFNWAEIKPSRSIRKTFCLEVNSKIVDWTKISVRSYKLWKYFTLNIFGKGSFFVSVTFLWCKHFYWTVETNLFCFGFCYH